MLWIATLRGRKVKSIPMPDGNRKMVRESKGKKRTETVTKQESDAELLRLKRAGAFIIWPL